MAILLYRLMTLGKLLTRMPLAIKQYNLEVELAKCHVCGMGTITIAKCLNGHVVYQPMV